MSSHLPVNPHTFEYTLKPTTACRGSHVYLLTYVHTAPSHFRQRAAIRQTWGNANNFKDLNFRVVFLMGLGANVTEQEAIALESDLHGDIVQENFVDSYRNLTYKGIMALKWTSRYCPNAKYVLKSDDDIFVNIFNVVNHLQSLDRLETPLNRTIICMVWSRMRVVRNPRSKWYVPRSEFWPDYFPQYCSGSAFMLTGDMIRPMYNSSLGTPFFWVDDYYVTGLLADKVGATHMRLNSVYSLKPKEFLDKFTDVFMWQSLTFGHVHDLDWWFEVWDNVLRARSNAE